MAILIDRSRSSRCSRNFYINSLSKGFGYLFEFEVFVYVGLDAFQDLRRD